MKSLIGVFDSGVGGLSVAKAVIELLPDESLLYVADTAYAPYGDKSAELIYQRMAAISAYLQQQGAKAIVVACNTATTAAIAQLRAEFNLPIIGVEPGIKPAVQLSRSGVIGVLATPRTIQNPAFAALASRVAGNSNVIMQPCAELVAEIEALRLDSALMYSLLRRYIAPLIAQGADTLVLGCTHYNFIAEQIAQVATELAGSQLNIIRTEQAVAHELKRRLAQAGLLATERTENIERFVTSGDVSLFQRQLQRLWCQDSKAEAI